MKFFFTFLTFLLLVPLFGQADYTGSRIPTDAVIYECAGTSGAIAVNVTDSGTNGADTDFNWIVSSPNLTFNSATSGVISDGSTTIIGMNYSLSGLASGIITVTCRLTNTGGANIVDVIFVIDVETFLTTTISNPSGVNVICPSSSTTLLATASGAANAYQWYKNGVAVMGATSSSIAVMSADAGSYTCTSFNDCTEGPQSMPIALSAGTVTSVTSESCTESNNDYTYTVNADGNNLTFEWRENGTVVTNGGDFTITSTATSSTIVVTNVEPTHDGSVFTCFIEGTCGSDVSGGCTTLPIELAFFQGRAITDKGVQLEWATAQEFGSDYFMVQRSLDGKTFEDVSKVKAAGNSIDLTNYSFLDQEVISANAQTVYYRLQETDLDGAKSFSDIINVAITNKAGFGVTRTIYQGGQIDFTINTANNSGEVTVSVFDLYGRVLATDIFRGTQYSLGTSNLSNGTYFIKMTQGQFTDVNKVQIVR